MIHCALSPIARVLQSGNQGVEVEVVPFTISPNNPQAEILLPVSSQETNASLRVHDMVLPD